MNWSEVTVRRPALAYAIATAALALAVAMRWLLDPLLGDRLPLIMLFAAVAAAVWAGGWLPALLVMAAGYLTSDYLFIPPRGTLRLGDAGDLVGLLAYLFTCAIIVAFGEAARTQRLRSEVRQETLRVTLASMGDAVITTDRDGSILAINRAAETLTGWTQAEAEGLALDQVLRLLDEATRAPAANPATRALLEGVVVGLSGNTLLLRRDGTELSIDDSAAPIRGSDGTILGCVVVFRDVAARRQLEQERADRLSAARLLAAIVESSDDAIVSKSLEGVIPSWNSGAQRLFGWAPEEAIGRHISLIIPPERAAEETEILARLRRGERIEHFDTVRVRRNGEPIHVSLTVSPVRDETGRVVGASKIARDIGDRIRLEQTLVEANRRKTEFLAVLAHELRGPLAPLRNALAILERGDAGPGVIDAARATMQRQLDQLVRLVDDLIDISRISRDMIELRREPVALDAVLQHAIEATRPLVERAGQRLIVGASSEPIHLQADPARLSQVFGNLLSNASKFTPEGGRITVTGELQGTEAVVAVEDDGIGIPVDRLEVVFDMFTQVEHPLARSGGGLGIGLALVRRLVEMHGGSVSAHSRGEGTGSRFVVRLPALEGPAQVPAPSAPDLAAMPPRRFLVVDDNVDTVSSLALLLKLRGHEARTAHDGREALRSVEEYRPQVVLLDIGLPELDGYEVCRRIRAQPWGRDIVLVALTGWGQEEDRRESKEAGFDHHLVKPVAYEALMSLLANA